MAAVNNNTNVDVVTVVIHNISVILRDHGHEPRSIYESILDIIAVKNKLRPAAILTCSFENTKNTVLVNKLFVNKLKNQLGQIDIAVFFYPLKGNQTFLNLIVTHKDNDDTIELIKKHLHSPNISIKDFHITTGKILGYLSPINIFNKENKNQHHVMLI